MINFTERTRRYKDIFANRTEGYCCEPSDFIQQEEFRVDAREEIEIMAKEMRQEIADARAGVYETNIVKDDEDFEREYISPYRTTKDKIKDKKYAYIKEVGDTIFEYNWNIMSYDNYNASHQDPETYDYDFNLAETFGERRVLSDRYDEEKILADGEYEPVRIKFYPKAYRYYKGIYYNDVERDILSVYRLANSMCRTSETGRPNPLKGSDPAYDYVQNEIDKYHMYLEFCNKYELEPEWKDVHRHYGIWFTQEIITYDIWEEWASNPDDAISEILLDSIFNGNYFEYNRIEIENIRNNQKDEDKMWLTCRRHKDMFPVREPHFEIVEDEWILINSYDKQYGCVGRDYREIQDLLEDDPSEVGDILADYNLAYREGKYDEAVVEVEKECALRRPYTETDAEVELYKEIEFEREMQERGIYDIEDSKVRSILATEIRFDVGLCVETHMREFLFSLNEELYEPPYEYEGIGWVSTANKTVATTTRHVPPEYDNMIMWRGGKFHGRAKDTVFQLRDSLSENIYALMTSSVDLNAPTDGTPPKRSYNPKDFDLIVGRCPCELDAEWEQIAAECMEGMAMERRVRQSQYQEGEEHALGFHFGESDSAGKMYAHLTRDELLDIPCEPWE
ncbi:MAG: hypothetical protein ACRC0G_07555 [Fusobacteriaceae bacterium]